MKVSKINVIDGEYVYLTVDAEMDVLKQGVNGLEKTKDTEFSMSRRDLSRQLQNINDDMAMLAALKGGLHQKELVLLLTGSELDIESKFHAAGEVNGDYTYNYDTFERVIKGVNLSPRAEKILDKALEL